MSIQRQLAASVTKFLIRVETIDHNIFGQKVKTSSPWLDPRTKCGNVKFEWLYSHFYARKQLLLSARLCHRNSVSLSVCPSVRLSHGWISQKRSS